MKQRAIGWRCRGLEVGVSMGVRLVTRVEETGVRERGDERYVCWMLAKAGGSCVWLLGLDQSGKWA